MVKGEQRLDRDRVSFNLARLKVGRENFEIVVNPDEAIDYKNGKDMDIRDVLKSEKIFSDASQGKLASEHELEKLFKTADPIEVAGQIIRKGEIQLTAEYRAKLRAEKIRRIIDIIHRNAVDPKTGFPHPPQRIEAAIEEAKVRIDDLKRAEDQIQEVVSRIRSVLPLSFQIKKIQVLIPPQYAAKSYALLKNFGTVIKDEWQNNGALLSVIEMPAGLQQDFLDELNKATHGNVEVKEVK